MNTPQQSLGDNPENVFLRRRPMSPGSGRTPMRSSTSVARRKHWGLLVADFLIPLGAIAVIAYLLRAVPADLLRQEFEGLGVVIWALACGGILLWRVSRALAQNTKKAEEANRGLGSSLSSAGEKREGLEGENAGIKRRPDPFGSPACGEHMERRT